MAGHSKWANIKHRKAKVDAIKGKTFTKIGRELIVAARQGGADPNANFRLKIAVQKAKAANMPNDNINRAIQRGAGGIEGSDFEELSYEGYGPGGVAVMVKILTDNRNRTAGEIRHFFSKYGGNMGEAGCVSWIFKQQGVINIDVKNGAIVEDELLLNALEAGATDMKIEEELAEVITDPDQIETVKEALTEMGYQIETAEVTLIPQNTVVVNELEQANRLLKLMDLLDEHDDVQSVHANFIIPEEIMSKL